MANEYCNYDTDFGGDDLKLVEYDVVYDKYCEEAWVGRGRTLINYATTAEAFASTALTDFIALLAKESGCAELIDPHWTKERLEHVLNETKDGEDDNGGHGSERRRRYLYCRSPRIIDRWPRRDRDCDSDEVARLDQIRREIRLIRKEGLVLHTGSPPQSSPGSTQASGGKSKDHVE
jgi:hypothetical protein